MNMITVSSSSNPEAVTSSKSTSKCLPFLMDNGQPGYVPLGTDEGDLICQFLGCDIAVALREKNDGYAILGRVFLAKWVYELRETVDAWPKKYFYSVPNYHSTFKWATDQEIDLYLDIATLQQLTA
jgi:hypothetical protein